MSDLRARIADALLGDHCVQGMTAPCDDCRAHALRQADAVIAELGLRDEWGALDHDMGGVLADTREEITAQPLHHSERIMHRYITDWTADGQ